MVFVLEDDNCIHGYASAEDAARAIEPIDVNDVIRAAFDDRGRQLTVRWIVQPKRDGFIVGGGRYELVPEPKPDIEGFGRFVSRATLVPAGLEDVARTLLGVQAAADLRRPTG